ncbi:MAG: transglutaminase domain-containing protein [Caldilineaceae bacterium]|nr:transglutaminase domain-containing protein [Caldilineaceae bacterium]
MSAYYATHSSTTDPGAYASLLDGLPADLAGIARVSQGLVYHYFGDEQFYGWKPPAARLAEINSRTIARILATLPEKDNRPLTEPRAYADRMVGCCRDFSLIACAILRQQGRAARLRYGFADYFVPGPWWMDHVIVEVWEETGEGGRWRRFDPELTAAGDWPFDPLDMPAEPFVTGGRAWQMCRAGEAKPQHFGLGPDNEHVRGWWFIRERLQLDVAALNKVELLCWDSLETLSEERPADLLILDEMAALSQRPDSAALRARCAEDEAWQLPDAVRCFHPAAGESMVAIAP